jgi:small redox-active disulfide protein 2
MALDVKVLGMGCAKCEKLEQLVRGVLASNNIEGNLEHVRDPGEIATYGMMPTPALVVNGEVKSAGKIPKEKQVLMWLQQALGR